MRPILIDKGLDIRYQNKESTNNRKFDNDQIYQTFADKAKLEELFGCIVPTSNFTKSELHK